MKADASLKAYRIGDQIFFHLSGRGPDGNRYASQIVTQADIEPPAVLGQRLMELLRQSSGLHFSDSDPEVTGAPIRQRS